MTVWITSIFAAFCPIGGKTSNWGSQRERERGGAERERETGREGGREKEGERDLRGL